MSNRLDKEREAELQPKRIDYARKVLTDLGFEITFQDHTRLEFYFNGELIRFFAFSGWHSGKSIKDGRGLNKLLKQLK